MLAVNWYCNIMVMELFSSQIKYLNLSQPLEFEEIQAYPSSILENDEFLLCYEINQDQSRSIEPEREQFLGNLSFIGKKAVTGAILLPAGRYIFAQYRRETPLNPDEWLDMAIELQKDGLWERNKLGNLLYVRFLHEDSKFVTQIFREIN